MTDEELTKRLDRIEKRQGQIVDILRTIFNDDNYISRLAHDIADGNTAAIRAHNRRFAEMQKAGMNFDDYS